MTTAKYRVNGGEVSKISLKGQVFDPLPAGFAVLTDPLLPDGSDIREPTDDLGPPREFGFAKIAVPASNLVRNATQDEIDEFPDFEEEDKKELHVEQANVLLKDHPHFGRINDAVWGVFLEELNELRQSVMELATQIEQLKADLANSSLYEDFQVETAKQLPVKKDFPDLPLAALQGRQSALIAQNK